MKIILILALIFIAQGVDAIEVGLIQESGQMQSTYVYNSIFCSPPPDCGEVYHCDALLDRSKFKPDICDFEWGIC